MIIVYIYKANGTQVKTYDLIFSNRTSYRVSRHLVFWMFWFVYWLVSFYIPNNVFPHWDIQGAFHANRMNIQNRGAWEIISQNFTISFRTFLFHVIFTYSALSLLQYYLSKRKYWILATGLFLLIFAIIVYGNYWSNYIAYLDSYSKGYRAIMPGRSQIITSLEIGVLSNYPVVAGYAITIKLVKRWYFKQRETEEIAKEKIKAELQLLKAQIHPHFLFNSLNNIYSFTLEASPKAPEMIQKLSGLIHYMLYECNQPQVPLEKELKMVQDYIGLEKIRYGERLKSKINIQDEALPHESIADRKLMISPLLLLPFIENSFKHGTSKMLDCPEVNLDITINDEMLYFRLVNSIPPHMENVSRIGNRGLGLKNVRKRLTLIYPERHELKVEIAPATYSVILKLVLSESEPTKVKSIINKEAKPGYELA